MYSLLFTLSDSVTVLVTSASHPNEQEEATGGAEARGGGGGRRVDRSRWFWSTTVCGGCVNGGLSNRWGGGGWSVVELRRVVGGDGRGGGVVGPMLAADFRRRGIRTSRQSCPAAVLDSLPLLRINVMTSWEILLLGTVLICFNLEWSSCKGFGGAVFFYKGNIALRFI